MKNEETLDWAIGCKDKQILELWQQIERLETALAPYRWRPIAEIHEDCGHAS